MAWFREEEKKKKKEEAKQNKNSSFFLFRLKLRSEKTCSCKKRGNPSKSPTPKCIRTAKDIRENWTTHKSSPVVPTKDNRENWVTHKSSPAVPTMSESGDPGPSETPTKSQPYKAKSKIWSHFKWLEDDKAECDHCGSKISRPQRNTTNMWAHLRGKHPTVWHDLRKRKEV